MRRARAMWLSAALLAVAAAPAGAQSIYNLYLLGQRVDTGDVRAIALGGGFQMPKDSLAVTQLNPAMIAYAKRVTFGASVYSGVDLNDTGTVSDREGALKLTSFKFAFSAFTRRLTLAVGYHGRYDPTAGFTTPLVTGAGDAYDERFERSGGLLSVPFCAAVDLGRRLKLGGFVSVESGSIEQRWEVDFTSLVIVDAFSRQTRTMDGNGWGVGAELVPLAQLALGVAYEAEIRYDTDVDERHTNKRNNRSYTETTVLPERWLASVRWHLTPRATLYAGGTYSDFKQFRGLAFPPERLATERVASLGFERQRTVGSMPLRASATWESLPYTLPDGKTVNRFSGSLGTGWRFQGGKGKLDVTLQYAQTGSVGENGQENRSIRLYVGVGGAEVWSHRRERR